MNHLHIYSIFFFLSTFTQMGIELEKRVLKVGIKDVLPLPPKRNIVKKVKHIKPGPRKPYKIYKSLDDIEIFVGKSAVDNEILSLDPDNNIRDQNDW